MPPQRRTKSVRVFWATGEGRRLLWKRSHIRMLTGLSRKMQNANSESIFTSPLFHASQACRNIFQSPTTATKEQRHLIEHVCNDNNTNSKVLNCVKQVIDLTPIDNSRQCKYFSGSAMLSNEGTYVCTVICPQIYRAAGTRDRLCVATRANRC